MKRKLRGCIPKTITVIIMAVVFQFALGWIIMDAKMEWQGPSDGLWFCEELQIQLCLQPNLDYIKADSSLDSRSFALVDNRYVMCDIRTDAGTYALCVIHQDTSDESNLDDTLFEGDLINVSNQKFEVRDKQGTMYVFHRVDEFSLDDKLDNCAQQVAQYSGVKNVGSTKHITAAIQKATQIWSTELGINVIDQKSVRVAFDFSTECWYVSTLSPTALIALIDYDGNVLGVWGQGDGL